MSCIYSIDGISRKERERGKKREKRDNVKDKEISWRVRREKKSNFWKHRVNSCLKTYMHKYYWFIFSKSLKSRFNILFVVVVVLSEWQKFAKIAGVFAICLKPHWLLYL